MWVNFTFHSPWKFSIHENFFCFYRDRPMINPWYHSQWNCPTSAKYILWNTTNFIMKINITYLPSQKNKHWTLINLSPIMKPLRGGAGPTATTWEYISPLNHAYGIYNSIEQDAQYKHQKSRIFGFLDLLPSKMVTVKWSCSLASTSWYSQEGLIRVCKKSVRQY